MVNKFLNLLNDELSWIPSFLFPCLSLPHQNDDALRVVPFTLSVVWGIFD